MQGRTCGEEREAYNVWDVGRCGGTCNRLGGEESHPSGSIGCHEAASALSDCVAARAVAVCERWRPAPTEVHLTAMGKLVAVKKQLEKVEVLLQLTEWHLVRTEVHMTDAEVHLKFARAHLEATEAQLTPAEMPSMLADIKKSRIQNRSQNNLHA